MSVQTQVIVKELQKSYKEAFRLIDFTEAVRGQKNENQGKYSIKLQDLSKLFKDWVERPDGGHKKVQHRLTHVTVKYSNHGNGDLDPGAAETILDAVQTHLNLLHNEIFKYPHRGWDKGKFMPDFKTSAEQYQIWEQNR